MGWDPSAAAPPSLPIQAFSGTHSVRPLNECARMQLMQKSGVGQGQTMEAIFLSADRPPQSFELRVRTGCATRAKPEDRAQKTEQLAKSCVSVIMKPARQSGSTLGVLEFLRRLRVSQQVGAIPGLGNPEVQDWGVGESPLPILWPIRTSAHSFQS